MGPSEMGMLIVSQSPEPCGREVQERALTEPSTRLRVLTRKFHNIRLGLHSSPSVHLLIPLSRSSKTKTAPLLISLRSSSLSLRLTLGMMPLRTHSKTRRASCVLELRRADGSRVSRAVKPRVNGKPHTAGACRSEDSHITGKGRLCDHLRHVV